MADRGNIISIEKEIGEKLIIAETKVAVLSAENAILHRIADHFLPERIKWDRPPCPPGMDKPSRSE